MFLSESRAGLVFSIIEKIPVLGVLPSESCGSVNIQSLVGVCYSIAMRVNLFNCAASLGS